MTTGKKSTASRNKNVTNIGGDVVDSIVTTGDGNTVTVNKSTIIQKIFNIFKSDAEALEQRNRRILLNHVENAWIKGVLDASLYGAAMLDLGIKETPEAITNKYPWTLKTESTNETLPAGTSMLEIFESIGMGRSLLILGAPGSGKTTMLLELARGLIARAREDVTQPIPMVFNLSSWTESKTLADWLAQELNNLYSVPRKTAPDWVKGDKLLLLLDGLDEVRQESRAKCVETINEFRKQNGLTSLAVCSRSQDYTDLNAKLAFEGAIEVQPLTQEQIGEFFNRFGNEMTGIKHAFEKDNALREMAETPLFLSIMLLAYWNKHDVEIIASQGYDNELSNRLYSLELKHNQNIKRQRQHLFDTYINCMFERAGHSNEGNFKKVDVTLWLTWLAHKMIQQKQIIFLLERLNRDWLETLAQQKRRNAVEGVFIGLALSITGGLVESFGVDGFSGLWIYLGLLGFMLGTLFTTVNHEARIERTTELIYWNWRRAIVFLIFWTVIGLVGGFLFGFSVYILSFLLDGGSFGMEEYSALTYFGTIVGLGVGLFQGFDRKEIEKISVPNQGVWISIKSAIIFGLLFGLSVGLTIGLIIDPGQGLMFGVLLGSMSGLLLGGYGVINNYVIRLILFRFGYMPINYIPFLDHCVDLIFLRRIGGGYIFIHRLLMEHFAEMYVEAPTSKGN